MPAAEKTIIIASPRGFCAGVVRAIETVEAALRIFKHPLYVHHEIVHNKYVVENLEKKGVIFIDDLDEMPDNLPVIFSAHGVSPAIRKKAEKKNLQVIDATCPLVTKVHQEAIRYAKSGHRIFYIGHKNHAETDGVAGEAPEDIEIIENEKQIENLNTDREKTAVLTQTTLSLYDTKKLQDKLLKRFPNLKTPNTQDICFATTNRQEAVRELAGKCDIVFVLGSKNSSNSNRLKETSESFGTPSFLIDSPEEIDSSRLKDVTVVGITAGASAPEILVEDTVRYLKEKFNFVHVENLIVKEETTGFSIPDELQKLLAE